MKTLRICLLPLIMLLLACGEESSTVSVTPLTPQDSLPTSTTDEFVIDTTHVVTGVIENVPFVFVSGYYSENDQGFILHLYPAEPDPVDERVWGPYASSLSYLIIPIAARVGAHSIPFYLDAGSNTQTTPTFYYAPEQKNISASEGVVAIYSIDETKGILTGALNMRNLKGSNSVNGTFSIKKLGSF